MNTAWLPQNSLLRPPENPQVQSAFMGRRSTAASGGRLAPASSAMNSVKVYNLSSVGKALPSWVSAGKRKNITRQREEDERLEVIQELWFPTACGRVKSFPLELAAGRPSLARRSGPPSLVQVRHPGGKTTRLLISVQLRGLLLESHSITTVGLRIL